METYELFILLLSCLYLFMGILTSIWYIPHIDTPEDLIGCLGLIFFWPIIFFDTKI